MSTRFTQVFLNVVTERAGIGSAVLIRALQPLWGLEQMQMHRGIDDARQLARGPLTCVARSALRLHRMDLTLSPAKR